MSDTFSIACVKCRKHLWIGQGRPRQSLKECRLYGGEKYDEALREFMYAHLDHPLVFGNNCDDPIADFEEIEVKEEPIEIRGTCNMDAQIDTPIHLLRALGSFPGRGTVEDPIVIEGQVVEGFQDPDPK